MIGGDVAKKVDYAYCSFEKQLPIDGCYAGTQTRGLKDGEAYAYLLIVLALEHFSPAISDAKEFMGQLRLVSFDKSLHETSQSQTVSTKMFLKPSLQSPWRTRKNQIPNMLYEQDKQ